MPSWKIFSKLIWKSNQIITQETTNICLSKARWNGQLQVKCIMGCLSQVSVCFVVSTFFFPQKWARPSVNSMGLASGLIRVQLFLAVQNCLFCCLILKIGVYYHIVFMYYLNCEHTVVQTVLPFTARCYSSRYFPIAVNEPEVLPIDLLPHWRTKVDTGFSKCNKSFSYIHTLNLHTGHLFSS